MKDTQCGRDAEPKAKGGCISTYRTNFAYVDSMKVNTMSFKQMEELGVYMVTNSFGFSMKYLELSYLRLLRGNLTPGQEGRVRLMSENGKPIHAQRFQSHTQSFWKDMLFQNVLLIKLFHSQSTTHQAMRSSAQSLSHFVPLQKCRSWVSMATSESTGVWTQNGMKSHELFDHEAGQEPRNMGRIKEHAPVPQRQAKDHQSQPHSRLAVCHWSTKS